MPIKRNLGTECYNIWFFCLPPALLGLRAGWLTEYPDCFAGVVARCSDHDRVTGSDVDNILTTTGGNDVLMGGQGRRNAAGWFWQLHAGWWQRH